MHMTPLNFDAHTTIVFFHLSACRIGNVYVKTQDLVIMTYIINIFL